jgi:Glycine transporter
LLQPTKRERVVSASHLVAGDEPLGRSCSRALHAGRSDRGDDERVQRAVDRAPAGPLEELHDRWRDPVRDHRGIAGGVSRDIILGEVPAPFLNPRYLFFSIDAALIGSGPTTGGAKRFREEIYQFAILLSLSWYAAVGANVALEHGLPYVSSILVGIIGATAGRYVVDLTCGVTPKHFIRGEWFVGTAVLVSTVYVVCDAAPASRSGRRR